MPQLPNQQIDGLLPELPSIARLVVARDLTGQSELLAINLDSKRQCGIDRREAYNFIPDLIGLDPTSAARYTQGYPIAAGMSVENWAAWLEGCEFVEAPGFVWLTVSKEGDHEDSIGGLCLIDKREAIAPSNEISAFLADLIGFNPASFEQGRSVVCRMTAENWASWLALFEVALLDADTITQLCS